MIATLGPDELFGEMALSGSPLRSACARAHSDCELLVITHQALSEQLDQSTPLIRHLLKIAVARSRVSLSLLQPDGTAEHRHDEDLDHAPAVERLRVEHRLRDALRDGLLELHYQPLITLSDRRTAGFESLIRWRDDNGRWIPPDAFIGIAEDSGLIVQIGHWIIETAAAAVATMSDTERKPFCTVNLSPRQMDDPQLFATIQRAIQQHALQPGQLRLEITESMMLGNLQATEQLLAQCRALGCPLLVDDFGSGYSSLAYLHRLPVDAIKLDRSFTSALSEDARAVKIVGAIARLAADLDMYTVAEGIETSAQADICQKQGIRYGQGYLFSAALPLAQARLSLSASD